jgi:hypothetical protein
LNFWLKTLPAPPVEPGPTCRALAHLSASACLVEPDQVARSNQPGHSMHRSLLLFSLELWRLRRLRRRRAWFRPLPSELATKMGRHRKIPRWRTCLSVRSCRLLPCVLIRLKRIYNFWCSMLVFTPFAYCFVTLRGTFMHFLELTY